MPNVILDTTKGFEESRSKSPRPLSDSLCPLVIQAQPFLSLFGVLLFVHLDSSYHMSSQPSLPHTTGLRTFHTQEMGAERSDAKFIFRSWFLYN